MTPRRLWRIAWRYARLSRWNPVPLTHRDAAAYRALAARTAAARTAHGCAYCGSVAAPIRDDWGGWLACPGCGGI